MTLTSVTEAIRHPDKFFIGGDWVDPSTSAVIEVKDSSTEETFLTVPAAAKADVDRAVAPARRAFDTTDWSLLPPSERAKWLRKIADAWASRSDAAADSWTAEAGVLRSMTQYNSYMLAGIFNKYADLADNFAWQTQHVS